MSILPTNGIRPDALRSAPARRPIGFSVADQPSKLSDIGTLSTVATDPLLFLQEVDSPQERDARSRRYGTDLLDLLTKLQHGLLDGAAPDSVLNQLRTLSGQLIVAANPTLREAVEAITLRAHVEIARGQQITKNEQFQ